MITIADAANESNMTYCAIRQLCLEQKIQYIRVGVSQKNGKYLINKKSLYDYLSGNCDDQNITFHNRKIIRKRRTHARYHHAVTARNSNY